MSALPQGADVFPNPVEVGFGPNTDIDELAIRASGNRIRHVNRFVVISGCSSGGKSTLLAELGRRGYAVVDEPGRRIVKDETS